MTTKTYITMADIEGKIAAEFYFNAADGINGAAARHGGFDAPHCIRHDDTYAETAASQITICVMILRNGTKVVGIN